MTQTLINELRKLHTRSTDEEDRAILGALLKAEEAREAESKPRLSLDEPVKGRCGHVAAISQIDDEGRCPDCVLIWMHDTFSRRRAEAIKNGW